MNKNWTGCKKLACLDFGASGIKVVRLVRSGGKIIVTGATILPPLQLDGSSLTKSLSIPRSLRANYGAVCISGENGLIRLINMPAKPGNQRVTESLIREQFHIDKAFRLHYSKMSSSQDGHRYLAVAVPERHIETVLAVTERTSPAPVSLEIAGLAALNSFLFQHGGASSEDGVYCFIEGGARTVSVFFVSRERLVLVRKFDVGGMRLRERVQQEYDVDEETANNILAENAVDISAVFSEVLGFVLHQLSISHDFVERQENCRLRRVYLSGGLAMSVPWRSTLQEMFGLEVEILDPFSGLNLHGEGLQQRPRFGAAVGAGLGILLGNAS